MRILAFVLAVCIGTSAFADDFYPIDSATASTAETDLWPASNLIQGPGAGFNAAEPYERLVGGADGAWVTADPGGFPSDYIEAGGTPVITFDLGADVPLSEISVWGYSAGNTNGVSEFSLSFATEAEGAGSGSVTAGPFTTIGDLTTGMNDDTARQSFSFDDVTARYVEMTALDNFFVAPGTDELGNVPGGDRVGLGEVAFQVVPEPSSGLLLILGAFALRRRRK